MFERQVGELWRVEAVPTTRTWRSGWGRWILLRVVGPACVRSDTWGAELERRLELVWAQVGQEQRWVAIAGTLGELEDTPSVVSPCSEWVS